MSGIDDIWKDIADSFRDKGRDQTAEAYDMLARKAAFDRGELTDFESEQFVGAYKEYVKECAKEREMIAAGQSPDANSKNYLEAFQRLDSALAPAATSRKTLVVTNAASNTGPTWIVDDNGQWHELKPGESLTLGPPPAPEIPENAKDNPALFDALNNIEPNPEHGMRSNLSKWS